MARVGRGESEAFPEGAGPAQLDADPQGEAVPEGIITSDSGPEGAQTVAKIVRLGTPAGP